MRSAVTRRTAYEAGLIDRPVRYGPSFKKPSKKVLRKARNDKGPRMFEALGQARRSSHVSSRQIVGG
jgi:hypothetical protein